jgi:hypothetical protein
LRFSLRRKEKTIDLYRRGAEGVKKFLDEISENRSGIGGDATLRSVPNPKNEKDADADIPIFVAAKAECAKLH